MHCSAVANIRCGLEPHVGQSECSFDSLSVSLLVPTRLFFFFSTVYMEYLRLSVAYTTGIITEELAGTSMGPCRW